MGANSAPNASVSSALNSTAETSADPTSASHLHAMTIPNIAETFANRDVLVTGGSGFLGKVLIEKLLHSVKDIHNIYVIIRTNKHGNAEERLQKILQDNLFNRIRHTDPSLFDKLVPISGDLMQPEIGLNESDTKLICQNVSIVFHCAATVKFDEALKDSIRINVIGTQQLMALCKRMPQLISVVHTSTAYANCNLKHTEERIYKPCAQPKKVIELAEWMDKEQLDGAAPHLLGGRPNTYTFAKSLCEWNLQEVAQELPLIIVRPSIVGAMWRDPLPGWKDNINGPTGLFAAVGKGVLTNMIGSVDGVADIIPVDIVSNALIAAAVYRSVVDTKEDATIPIIHCSSGVLNPIHWGKIIVFIEQFFHSYPLQGCIKVPSTQFHGSQVACLLNFYLKHYYLAYAVDMALRIMKRRPKMVRMYDKVWRMVETLRYFTCRSWRFDAENIVTLWDSLSDSDKKTYNFDVRQIDWDSYLFDYLMGMKKYLLKERLDDLPVARANLAWANRMSVAANVAGWGIIVRLLMWRQPRKARWYAWMMGICATYTFGVLNRRPRLMLKSLEEYSSTSLPAYA